MAKDVKLKWDANNEDDLAGYRLYYKTGSQVIGDDLDASVIDIPLAQIDKDNPEYTVTGLDPALIYFFAVTAYDNENPINESWLSNGASTLRITEPGGGFFVHYADKSVYTVKGRGIPHGEVGIFANDVSLGTTTCDAEAGWVKHVDFTLLNEGSVRLTAVSTGSTSFPVKGIYDTIAPEVISIPAVTSLKDTFAVIEWETDEPGTGIVEYGPDISYGFTQTGTGYTTGYSVLIKELDPDKLYHFRVSSEDAAGNGPEASSSDNNPSTGKTFTTLSPVPPSIVEYPFLGLDYIVITYDEPDMQNAGIEGNYSFNPALNFYTLEEQDDIYAIDEFSYLLFMKSIPQYEIIALTVSNITDWSGNPVTPATIIINDNDSDNMGDDWEVEYGFNTLVDDGSGDADGDGYNNLQEYQSRTDPRDAAVRPFIIQDAFPQQNAGINNDARIPIDSAVAVLIRSAQGIDITEPDSIRFTIDDGHHAPYQRDLNSDTVRVVKISQDDDSQATKIWAIYDRTLESFIPENFYRFDALVSVTINARDVLGNPMNQAGSAFRVESEEDHLAALENIPETLDVDPGDPGIGGAYDRGIEVISGKLAGAKIIYNSGELRYPAFGSMDVIKGFNFKDEQSVGIPLNLVPHTVFDTPVKVFIPCPGYSDVNNLSVYFFNGVEWVAVCSASGMVLPGGDGLIVPDSRVNHNDYNPPVIEVQVYHFSGLQAAVPVAADTAGGGGGGGCFIEVIRAKQNLIPLLAGIFITIAGLLIFIKWLGGSNRLESRFSSLLNSLR